LLGSSMAEASAMPVNGLISATKQIDSIQDVRWAWVCESPYRCYWATDWTAPYPYPGAAYPYPYYGYSYWGPGPYYYWGWRRYWW